MLRKRIAVRCYSGARVDERPQVLTIDGREYRVVRLISERLERPESEPDREHRRYSVMTESGQAFDVTRDEDGSWWLDQ